MRFPAHVTHPPPAPRAPRPAPRAPQEFTELYHRAQGGDACASPKEVLRHLLAAQVGPFAEACAAKAWTQVLAVFYKRFEGVTDLVLRPSPGGSPGTGAPKSIIASAFEVSLLRLRCLP